MSLWLVNLIRVVHVLSSSAWLGGAVLNTAFLMPSVTALGRPLARSCASSCRCDVCPSS